ncbi:nucleotide sugar dehydrogenase [Novosphingobium sp. KACC 22771]|uniref:nucleotide sugar dehydrogenase n=1 Tax=Novosphingobium sp. KACC 22771 TaxID=3025670 RepID=UPI002366DEEC|nr:nucleotide sugar dehydrogenase [Novosphingobium sp. KACC 22771]WDF74656.1 nucleotide sugar dehydrogenase [Novosphingobium sp. KACC 22771]
MKIAIFGLGYVGFTAACCIASEGHHVVGVDVSDAKIAAILDGRSPITEPKVDEMLAQGLADGLITATTNVAEALKDTDLALVCVGTPSGPDGSHDMRYIADVSRQIAAAVDTARETPLTVVFRSTIRPGTMDDLVHPIFAARHGADTDRLIELVYNPEFLREATAVYDYFAPPKIVIGTADGKPSATMDALYAAIEAPRFYVRFREAEATKFVDNTWHAVKVAFGNEIGRVCLGLGINASDVYDIFVSDTKLNISKHYLRPGSPFGGSCLPKDVRALQRIAAECGANTHLVDSLLRSNDAHKHRMFARASEGLEPGAKILLAGLAFKAETDDLRESPNVDLARMLLSAGYDLSIFDPAIDGGKLVGANLGYIYARIPQIERLLLSAEQANATAFDRIVMCNGTGKKLDLANRPVVDLSKI